MQLIASCTNYCKPASLPLDPSGPHRHSIITLFPRSLFPVITHTRMHARTHTHTHAQTHAHTHTRTHAHTHPLLLASNLPWIVNFICALHLAPPCEFPPLLLATNIPCFLTLLMCIYTIDVHLTSPPPRARAIKLFARARFLLRARSYNFFVRAQKKNAYLVNMRYHSSARHEAHGTQLRVFTRTLHCQSDGRRPPTRLKASQDTQQEDCEVEL